jgi:Tfp pilus assembly protein PilF
VAGLTRELFSTSLFTVHFWKLFVALTLAALTAGGCSKAPPTQDELLARANDDFAAQHYDKAENAYREVLRLASDEPDAVRRLAHIYYDQGQLPQAYDLLKKAAELEPDNVEVQLDLSQTSVLVGDLPRAHDAALSVLAKRPGDEVALVVLANAATPEDAEDTRMLIEDLRAKDQDRAGYHLALGALALRKQDLAQADTEFEAAAKLNPKSALAHTALADSAWSRNDMKTADEAFKIAADLSPLRSPTQLRYADFNLRTGRPAEAKATLEKITAKYPDYLPPRVFSMKIACAEHQDEDCVARVQNILAQDPVNYEAVFQDGLLSLANGNANKAIREFEYPEQHLPAKSSGPLSARPCVSAFGERPEP